MGVEVGTRVEVGFAVLVGVLEGTCVRLGWGVTLGDTVRVMVGEVESCEGVRLLAGTQPLLMIIITNKIVEMAA
jgi:hypothetical protein